MQVKLPISQNDKTCHINVFPLQGCIVSNALTPASCVQTKLVSGVCYCLVAVSFHNLLVAVSFHSLSTWSMLLEQRILEALEKA